MVPDTPLLVPIPGLGPVLILLAVAVLAGLAWLIGRGACLTERDVACPVDGASCLVVTDCTGRLVACSPSPVRRGVECRAACLRPRGGGLGHDAAAAMYPARP
jgi:hypothetical protein